MDKAGVLKIEFEISQIDILLQETAPLLELSRCKTPDMVETAALGLFLHSFYNGIENILKMIISDLDKKLPSSHRWHKELLDRCFEKTDSRKEIFTEDLKIILDDYLSFRHFIRNTYSFRIKWEKMEQLILNINENWHKIKSEIVIFVQE